MGRVRSIQDNREDGNDSTFSWRRELILKKALELSLLGDNGVAVIMMAPNDRVIVVSSNSRAEDVMVGYARIPDLLGGGSRDEEQLSIQRNREIDARMARIEELKTEVGEITQQLGAVRERLRRYELDPSQLVPLAQAESCKSFLERAVNRINEIKEEVMREHVPPELRPLFQATTSGGHGPLPFTPLPARALQMAAHFGSSLQPTTASVEADPMMPASKGSVEHTTNEEKAEELENLAAGQEAYPSSVLPTTGSEMALVQEIEDALSINETSDEAEDDGYAKEA